ncbi:MAG: rpfG3 [Clostridia bacterium]|jgi:putative two-component system response regulator|nr:rpfG3 [Clostridia bacterium]
MWGGLIVMPKHILVVDDNVVNLKLAEQTLKPLYKVTLLISGTQALKFLSKTKPNLILLDINMPEMDGYEIFKKIKENPETSKIPIIFLTAQTDSESELHGLYLGAVDFIAKPFISEIMLSRIKMHLELEEYHQSLEALVEEKTQMIEKLQDVIVISLAELVECRDGETGGHVKRTAKYLQALVEAMDENNVYRDVLSKQYIKDILRAAPLHDIGKIGISDDTLLKQSSLDEEEFEYMKKHTTLGGKTLQKAIDEAGNESFLYIARDMALSHHEKWDGSGYPRGLKQEEIPLCGRIMAVADVYDALISRRSYKQPFTYEAAAEMIIKGKGLQFDPCVVEVFEKVRDKFERIASRYLHKD